jgi:hypothetical protein
MKTVLMVPGVMVLIALPIFAAPKPTPTPATRVKQLEGRAQREIKTTHSNTYKEGQPTPSPTAGPVAGTIINSTKGHTFKEGAPGTPTPTAGPAEVNQIKSTKSNASEKKIGEPVTTTTINTSKSNNLKEGAPGTPSPTAGPVAGTTINTTKSNSYREGQPKYVAARVLSQQGRRLTVQLSDGKTATVDSAGLNSIPRVGSTVSITESGGRWFIVTR